jgi:Predicted membrane protein
MRRNPSHRSRTNLNRFPRGGQSDTASPQLVSGLKFTLVPDFGGTSTFDNLPFLQSTLVFAGANVLGFIISLLTGSHLHLDLLGTGAFALASLPSLFSEHCPTRIFVSSAAVFTWSAKLASFLFFRALKLKTDGRLQDTLSTVSGTFGFWLISFMWGIICSLPHTLGTTSAEPGSSLALTLGGIVYLLGLATESMADYQKWVFKQNHPGKFCDIGLWSISQHPNFFGNLLLWSGILIMNSDSLIERGVSKGGEGILSSLWSSRRVFVAFLSPLFMWALFSGQASGNLTNAVELAQQKYGKDPKFREYLETVPKIIPNVLSWLKQLIFPTKS